MDIWIIWEKKSLFYHMLWKEAIFARNRTKFSFKQRKKNIRKFVQSKDPLYSNHISLNSPACGQCSQ